MNTELCHIHVKKPGPKRIFSPAEELDLAIRYFDKDESADSLAEEKGVHPNTIRKAARRGQKARAAA